MRVSRLEEAITSFSDAMKSVPHPFRDFSIEDMEQLFYEFLQADQMELIKKVQKGINRVQADINELKTLHQQLQQGFALELNDIALANSRIRRKIEKKSKDVRVKSIIWRTQLRKIDELAQSVTIDMPGIGCTLKSHVKDMKRIARAQRAEFSRIASGNNIAIRYLKQALINKFADLRAENEVKKDQRQNQIIETKQRLQNTRIQNAQIEKAILEMELFLDANGDQIPVKDMIRSVMTQKIREEVGLCL